MTDEAEQFNEALDRLLEGEQSPGGDPLLQLSQELRASLTPVRPAADFRARLKADLLERYTDNVRPFPVARSGGVPPAPPGLSPWRRARHALVAVAVASAASVALVFGYDNLHQQTTGPSNLNTAQNFTSTPTPMPTSTATTARPTPHPTRPLHGLPGITGNPPASSGPAPHPRHTHVTHRTAPPTATATHATIVALRATPTPQPSDTPAPSATPPGATSTPIPPSATVPGPTSTLPPAATVTPTATTSGAIVAFTTAVKPTVPPSPTRTPVAPSATPKPTHTPRRATATPTHTRSTAQATAPKHATPTASLTPSQPHATATTVKVADNVPPSSTNTPIPTATNTPVPSATHTPAPPTATDVVGATDTPVPASPAADTPAATSTGAAVTATATRPATVAQVTRAPGSGGVSTPAAGALGSPTSTVPAQVQFPMPSAANAAAHSPLANTAPYTPAVTLQMRAVLPPNPGQVAVFAPVPSQESATELLRSLNVQKIDRVILQTKSKTVALVRIDNRDYQAVLLPESYGYHLTLSLISAASLPPPSSQPPSFDAVANASTFLSARGLAGGLQNPVRAQAGSTITVTFAQYYNSFKLTGAQTTVTFNALGVLLSVDVQSVNTATAPLADGITPDVAIQQIAAGRSLIHTTGGVIPDPGSIITGTTILYVPVSAHDGIYYEPMYRFTCATTSGVPFQVYVPAIDRAYLH